MPFEPLPRVLPTQPGPPPAPLNPPSYVHPDYNSEMFGLPVSTTSTTMSSGAGAGDTPTANDGPSSGGWTPPEAPPPTALPRLGLPSASAAPAATGDAGKTTTAPPALSRLDTLRQQRDQESQQLLQDMNTRPHDQDGRLRSGIAAFFQQWNSNLRARLASGVPMGWGDFATLVGGGIGAFASGAIHPSWNEERDQMQTIADRQGRIKQLDAAIKDETAARQSDAAYQHEQAETQQIYNRPAQTEAERKQRIQDEIDKEKRQHDWETQKEANKIKATKLGKIPDSFYALDGRDEKTVHEEAVRKAGAEDYVSKVELDPEKVKLAQGPNESYQDAEDNIRKGIALGDIHISEFVKDSKRDEARRYESKVAELEGPERQRLNLYHQAVDATSGEPASKLVSLPTFQQQYKDFFKHYQDLYKKSPDQAEEYRANFFNLIGQYRLR